MPKLIVQDLPAPANLPTASPSSFGAGVGQAMQQTGRVAQALGQVLDEVAASNARANATRYETDLQTEMQKIALDPDIAGRQAKFDDVQRKVYERHRPRFGAAAVYDQRTAMAGADLRSRFQYQTMLDGIKEARLNTQLEVDHKALKAAQAETDEETLGYFAQIREDLSDASLYMTPAEQTSALQDAVGTGVRAMVDTNPKRALGIIDSMGSILKPEVLSVYRDEAVAAIKQSAAEEVARSNQLRIDAERAEKMRSDAAEDELATIDAEGVLSIDAVKRYMPMLSPDAKRRWIDRARSGNAGSSSTQNPRVYVDLTKRADGGEDVTEATNSAYLAGEITKSDRDSILKTSRDTRIGAARKFISTSLDANAFPGDMFAGTMEAQALQYFDAWAKDHPEATAEEAMMTARRQVSGVLAARPGGDVAAGLIRPVGAVVKPDDPRTVDIDATKAELSRLLQTGELDASSFAQEAVKLKRISDAQDARAERERRRRELAAGAEK